VKYVVLRTVFDKNKGIKTRKKENKKTMTSSNKTKPTATKSNNQINYSLISML